MRQFLQIIADSPGQFIIETACLVGIVFVFPVIMAVIAVAAGA